MRAIIGIVLLLSSLRSHGQPAEPQEDLLHADLPFYIDDHKIMWPKSFSDEDGFGCASRVGFGDWKLASPQADRDPRWFRLTNYGVLHCYVIIQDAYDRESLDDASHDYGHFVQIGQIRQGGRPLELWAIQRGGRPGSDYILLAREPAGGRITQFDLLQRACPREWIRDAGNIDILGTRYCAVPSREELVAFAKRMAKLPPLGRLTLEGDPPAADTQEKGD